MKKWVPDYSNRSDTDLMSGNKKSITITETGFVCFSFLRYGNGNESYMTINGKKVLSSIGATSGYGICTGVLPVSNGDILGLEYNTDTPHWMYFIPGKWV